MRKDNYITINNMAVITVLLLFALILTGCHIHKYVDGVCDCGSFDEKWLKQNFNMEEEINRVEINIDQDFTDDVILVLLRNSRTYPILNERHFILNENVTLEHLFNEPKRYSSYTDEEWEEYLNNYHQMVFIHVEPKGKEHIIELIKQIEKLPFVLAAEPNYSGTWFDKLSFESISTTNALKASVEWREHLNMNESYVPLINIFNKNEITKIKMIKGAYSSDMFDITDEIYFEGLCSLLDLPYTDITDKVESFFDEYKDIIIGDYNNYHWFFLNTNEDLLSIRIEVYDSGYVLITKTERTGNGVYDLELEGLYISLIPLNKDDFLKYVSAENLIKYFNKD